MPIQILFALALVMLVSTGLGLFLLLRTSPTAAIPVVGHLHFLSSGQMSETSNQGIADEVWLDLSPLRDPAPGKSYYTWLLPDEDQSENPVILLGKVTVIGGVGHVSYSDPQHTNLLAITSRLLVTEQDATITPLNPSTDKSDWRYLAQFPQTRPPGAQYSLLDHLRHLLADDPKLKAHGLRGGVTIWLYRNMQAVFDWSISATDAWQPGAAIDVSFIKQQAIHILDYLDGLSYVQRDLPATIPSPTLVDSRTGSIGLLQFDLQQEPPGYLQHVGLHLNGLASSPGASDSLRAHVAQILTALNAVHNWLEQIQQDARQLAAMADEHLRQPQALTLLNDLATNANFAYVGGNDPVTHNAPEGVEWIHQNIQSLATMDIIPYRE